MKTKLIFFFKENLVFQAALLAIAFHVLLVVLFKDGSIKQKNLSFISSKQISIISSFNEKNNFYQEAIKYGDPTIISRTKIKSLPKHKWIENLKFEDDKQLELFQIRKSEILSENYNKINFLDNKKLPIIYQEQKVEPMQYPIAFNEKYMPIPNIFKDKISLFQKYITKDTTTSVYKIKIIGTNSIPYIKIIKSSSSQELDDLMFSVIFENYKNISKYLNDNNKMTVYWSKK